jgi:hypothetical protein
MPGADARVGHVSVDDVTTATGRPATTFTDDDLHRRRPSPTTTFTDNAANGAVAWRSPADVHVKMIMQNYP